jgi:ABC-type dipeptide/oligopeptide/nickel transport system permease component/predicted ABC-type transport system involved in lysophospholipase L1 biosynthesis ATPase subunit
MDMTARIPALEAFSLTKSRRTVAGESTIWRSPDIVVQRAQFVTVLGQDPTDVQLLLAMLSGLVEPTGGVLRIDGQAAEDLPRPQRALLRARKVGFLFREPKLLPDLTVLENVTLPQRYGVLSQGAACERGGALLKRLGMGDALTKKPDELTDFEGQLVTVARALLNHPAVILADEPTAVLPIEDARHLIKLLWQLCEEEGIAVLLGTSDPRLVGPAAQIIRMPTEATEDIPTAAEEISTHDLFSQLYETEITPLLRSLGPLLDFVVKPLLYTAVVALVIVLLTFFGLTVAQAGRSGQSVDWAEAIAQSMSQTVSYLRDLVRGELGTYAGRQRFYYWEVGERSIAASVVPTVDKSLALLVISMALGGLIGVPLGLGAALVRHRKFSLLFLVAAIVGVSTPSFFLALLLQILEITFYRKTGITLLPVGGFGWDRHIVLPALVLAARPIAQVARVSFVSLATVLDADYIRTAHAKGLSARTVVLRHALRNAGVPTLTALGTSLGFSLSSLPIVEAIFQWPGMGDLLLQAIRDQQVRLAATLALILGVFFVIIHVALDIVYRILDPRLREARVGLAVQRSWTDLVSAGWSSLREVPDRLESLIPWLRTEDRETLARLPTARPSRGLRAEEQRLRNVKIRAEHRRAWIQSTVGSLPFVLGGVVLALLLGIVIFGQRLAPYSPYSTVSSLEMDGVLQFAPFSPSARFPLGTDQQGRDILSLLLYGARRTLSLAFFAVSARILLGFVLGALSGWFSNSSLDRLLMGITQVIAAFPALLLAMVLIYAFGIRQGLWVFALALCLIGWGESAQFVRGQVMHIREQDYVEGALATGLGDVQLLTRHVLPNLVPSLMVLACLEMGGVLMLLGELGFIGVFIGGGWTTRSVTDAVVTYFDVPEWGVMLSNTWRSFRSYPWMTFYPALAFTISIVGFNLFGEGLRRLTERLTLSMHRIINKYTIAAALGLGGLLLLTAEGTRSWPQFLALADQFSGEHAMAHIRYLASPDMNGRGIGTPELDAAADYIAEQFSATGLQPAGAMIDGAPSYFSSTTLGYRALETIPRLELRDYSGQPLGRLIYRLDYAEVPYVANAANELTSEVVCLGLSPLAYDWPETMDASPADLTDKTVLTLTPELPWAVRNVPIHGAILQVAPHEAYLDQRELLLKTGSFISWGTASSPFLYISPDVAHAILSHGGYSLEQVRERQDRLSQDEGFLLRTGVEALVDIKLSPVQDVSPRYVQAFIPGSDEILDNELVILLAHYEGQGPDLDGTLYPGANKNASGVAVMLEVSRLLHEVDYEPRRTVMFVAWAGEELHAQPSFWDMLRARPGFLENYRISAAIELIGVGAGKGNALLLDRSTSNRLTEVLQQAASRSKVKASTLGTGVHGVYAALYPEPDRHIPYVSVTWDGSNETAHTPQDTTANIEPEKVRDAGRLIALAVMYLAHEREY